MSTKIVLVAGVLEEEITLKPLVAMALSDNKHIRDADAMSVIRHFVRDFPLLKE